MRNRSHGGVIASRFKGSAKNAKASSRPAPTTWLRSSEYSMRAEALDEAYHVGKDRVVAQFEKEYLTRLIGRAGGNMSKAARLANIDRTTLYRLMDKHNFQRDELSGPTE